MGTNDASPGGLNSPFEKQDIYHCAMESARWRGSMCPRHLSSLWWQHAGNRYSGTTVKFSGCPPPLSSAQMHKNGVNPGRDSVSKYPKLSLPSWIYTILMRSPWVPKKQCACLRFWHHLQIERAVSHPNMTFLSRTGDSMNVIDAWRRFWE